MRSAGAAGRAVRHDIDVYLEGLNARLKVDGGTRPWTRVDIYSANAITGQIFGQGGGDEARRSELLSSLFKRYGKANGQDIFDDLSAFDDPDSPSTMSKRFPYGKAIGVGKGNAVLDAGSFKPTGPKGLARAASAHPRWSSNFLLVAGRRSTNGHPLFVAGPQIGYTYPGLTLEADISYPGVQARGATAPGFAGNILIGRGQDYAWSLTSAGSDLIDHYVETLCGGSRTRYLYKGRCRKMGTVDAGTIKDSGRVRFNTTVHGPVIGYAKVGGRTVAVSRKRASYGQDILWQLGFRDLTTGKVRSAATLRQAMSTSPFTFNVGYADDRDIAMYSAGRLPVRDRRVDPRLPTKGTGQYEWKGFLKTSQHPYQVNPPSGVLVNWNNRPAPKWGAADDNWSYGSVQRVRMLLDGLASRGTHDLASVTSAMNAAATQDLRSVALTPTLAKLLTAAPAPSPRAARMLALLEAWRAGGSSRLDRDLDGVIDAGPGPAIWDALYPRLWSAAMPVTGLGGVIGTDSGTRSGFTDGGFWYLDKDLRRLNGDKLTAPLNERYCGDGDRAKCARAVWAALEAIPGDPDALRVDATKERISFRPGLLPTTIRYTNRPSGIQQVMTLQRASALTLRPAPAYERPVPGLAATAGRRSRRRRRRRSPRRCRARPGARPR